MSVIVFHPSVAPHVQQAATALHECGQLARFITSVRDRPRSLGQRFLVGAGRVGGLRLDREFARRTVVELPDSLIETHPWGELLRVAVARLDPDRRLSDFIWERTEQGFDRRVARQLPAGAGGVYGFETSSLATFQRARSLGLAVAYEVPAPDPGYMQEVFEAEAARHPELRTPYHTYTAARDDERIARRRAEWRLATVIIVASRFSRDTYARAGLDTDRVRVVPLGAPPPVSREKSAPAGPGLPADLPLGRRFQRAKRRAPPARSLAPGSVWPPRPARGLRRTGPPGGAAAPGPGRR